MKFNYVTGCVGSYVQCNISEGDNSYSSGDTVWFSDDGCEMEIRSDISHSTLREICEMFENSEQAYEEISLAK